MFVFAVALTLMGCGKPSLEGVYENAPDTFVGHLSFTFKPQGVVTIKTFDKPIPDRDSQYKIEGDMVQIQRFAVPLKMYNDGSLDGNVWGVFKKK
jgi:hypothetical protein